ncbi:MAG: TetR/AcrR family transcriptional regulator [Caulobacteraceae bacterium]
MSRHLASLARQAPPPHPDGRRRRSQDSRARIVSAMLDLVRAGEVSPVAEQVAARAGVGLRTVFRHFKDMDGVYREMAVAIEAELSAMLRPRLRGETWRQRLADLIDRRALAFETIAPFKRAADAHRVGSAFLEARHARLTAASRAILREALPPAVAGDTTTLECLDLLLSYETWSRLRREQHLTPRRARATIVFAVGRLLGDPQASGPSPGEA